MFFHVSPSISCLPLFRISESAVNSPFLIIEEVHRFAIGRKKEGGQKNGNKKERNHDVSSPLLKNGL